MGRQLPLLQGSQSSVRGNVRLAHEDESDRDGSMTVGEIIAALAIHASEDYYPIMSVSVDSIEVHDGCIEIYATDSNTGTIRIDVYGEKHE